MIAIKTLTSSAAAFPNEAPIDIFSALGQCNGSFAAAQEILIAPERGSLESLKPTLAFFQNWVAKRVRNSHVYVVVRRRLDIAAKFITLDIQQAAVGVRDARLAL